MVVVLHLRTDRRVAELLQPLVLSMKLALLPGFESGLEVVEIACDGFVDAGPENGAGQPERTVGFEDHGVGQFGSAFNLVEVVAESGRQLSQGPLDRDVAVGVAG
ncbi:MAG: hypothetical protein OEV40_26870 [Acidimicrobiia bacterium]|nr:hypothetical protein [Acidimicrobiia bacterium]